MSVFFNNENTNDYISRYGMSRQVCSQTFVYFFHCLAQSIFAHEVSKIQCPIENILHFVISQH